MLRRRSLKRDMKAGWPDLAICMERAALSSGVPFAQLARAAKAARTALAECGQSTWRGAVSGDPDDPRNWRYNRLPRRGDACIFDEHSASVATGMDITGLTLGSLTITKRAEEAGFSIGTQGRAL